MFSTDCEFFVFSNVPEAVYLQHLMGVEGVIVDLVQEITEAVFLYDKAAIWGWGRRGAIGRGGSDSGQNKSSIL